MSSDAIVRAAADAIARDFYVMEAGELPSYRIEPNAGDMSLAQAAVDAVAPLIRAAALRKAAREMPYTGPVLGVLHRMADAAARGDDD